MSAHRALYAVVTLCRVLAISRSGYYEWLRRPASRRAREDLELTRRIRTIHASSRGTYGVPRVHAELIAQGDPAGKRRLARLMALAGLRGISRRKSCPTTVRDKSSRPAPDLVGRKFVAEGPDRLWVADIRYIPTWEGFLFLAIVLDAFSRKVFGWTTASTIRKELVIAALDSAVARRQPRNVIHHSDQGSQYTSIAFGSRCKALGVRPSMGSVGDAYDNAMAESFLATLECELLDRTTFRTQVAARMAIFDWIERWYSPGRRHSALSYLSPVDFERAKAAETAEGADHAA